MKQNINEIKRMQRIAGVITESEYNDSLMNEKDVLKYSFDDTQGTPRYRPGGGSDDGDEVYMEIRSKLTPEMQKKILKTIKREVFIDCRFEVKGNKLMLLIPFSGDYENVKGVLDSLGVKIKTI